MKRTTTSVSVSNKATQPLIQTVQRSNIPSSGAHYALLLIDQIMMLKTPLQVTSTLFVSIEKTWVEDQSRAITNYPKPDRATQW